MAPIPGMIREARFERQHRIYWTDYGMYTEIKTTDMQTSYSKLANVSHEFQDKWVTIASVLFAIIMVGIIAHFCFGGRHRYPRQSASTEDKMKLEDAEYLDMTEEPRSDGGWMCFIMACHAAITLGVV
ncbi:hypothetical protein N7447_009816 [Penicillium robsamsonii]|uniref:uncharacterized protein n=1 Tax=Penicillium robsamsonii TaxID=1792511 RepID=UPI00254840E8|nr:uncharacterized protein N7447_009816 [Penicillium robsamsonii]KAJ5812793.1 hypothetical protein N7447_009816 [Penicillium robsamsonii]